MSSWFFLTIITEILRYVLCFYGFFGCRLHKRKAVYLSVILFLLFFIFYATFGVRYDMNPFFTILSCTIISFLSCLLIFNEPVKKILLLYILITLATVTWDNLSLELIKPLHLLDTFGLKDIIVQQCICQSIGVIYILLWSILVRMGRIKKVYISSLSKPAYLLVMAGMLITAFLTSLSRSLSDNVPDSRITLFYMSIILFSIVFQIGCIMLVLLFYSRENMKMINHIREEFSEKQINYYQTLLEREEDTRKFRHDIRNHMICMKDLLDAENVEAAKEYISELYDTLGSLSNTCDTGSDIINAIINYYTTKGKKDHVLIKVRGYIRPEVTISHMHLCSVISNLMSNAYEAVLKLPPGQEKQITVEIKSGSKYIEFIIHNPTDTNRARLEHNLSTTKEDFHNHGYGLRNVKEIVSQYDGKFSFTDELNSVTVRVIMKTA